MLALLAVGVSSYTTSVTDDGASLAAVDAVTEEAFGFPGGRRSRRPSPPPGSPPPPSSPPSPPPLPPNPPFPPPRDQENPPNTVALLNLVVFTLKPVVFASMLTLQTALSTLFPPFKTSKSKCTVPVFIPKKRCLCWQNTSLKLKFSAFRGLQRLSFGAVREVEIKEPRPAVSPLLPLSAPCPDAPSLQTSMPSTAPALLTGGPALTLPLPFSSRRQAPYPHRLQRAHHPSATHIKSGRYPDAAQTTMR